MCAQLTYSETTENNLGPFTVEAKLLSVDRGTIYSSGTGKVRCIELHTRHCS